MERRERLVMVIQVASSVLGIGLAVVLGILFWSVALWLARQVL